MLNMYATLLSLNPYTFFGINQVTGDYMSHKIWTERERVQLEQALSISRTEMEQHLSYFLMPAFLVNEPHVFTNSTIRLKYAQVTNLGTLVITSIGTASPNYDEDIASVAITTTTPDLLHLYNPTTSRKILVTQRAFSSGVLTLSVPRYALLVDTNNPVAGWDFDDLSNYLTSVDVKSEVMDVAQIVTPITGYSLSLLNATMGIVLVKESPDAKTLLINYQSGVTPDFVLKSTWVSFAHAKLDICPSEDPFIKVKWLWARDIPADLSVTQRECSFGQFAGAYKAYRYVNINRLHRGSAL